MQYNLKTTARRGFALIGGTALALPMLAHAEETAGGLDLSAITASVNFSTVSAGVLGVAASLAVVYIAMRGARMLLSMIRGG